MSAEAFSLLVWRQTSVKTDKLFLRVFTRATTPSNTLKYHFYLPSHTLLCYPLSFHLYPVFPNHSGCLSTTPYLYIFYYTSFVLHVSLELSASCQQSRLNFCFFFTIHAQHLGLDWDLDLSRRPQLPSLTIYLSLTPHIKLAGVGALVYSFQTIGNTQPTLPYAITTHLNIMWLL